MPMTNRTGLDIESSGLFLSGVLLFGRSGGGGGRGEGEGDGGKKDEGKKGGGKEGGGEGGGLKGNPKMKNQSHFEVQGKTSHPVRGAVRPPREVPMAKNGPTFWRVSLSQQNGVITRFKRQSLRS